MFYEFILALNFAFKITQLEIILKITFTIKMSARFPWLNSEDTKVNCSCHSSTCKFSRVYSNIADSHAKNISICCFYKDVVLNVTFILSIFFPRTLNTLEGKMRGPSLPLLQSSVFMTTTHSVYSCNLFKHCFSVYNI